VAFFTNVIHRFGVSNSIITDNGTKFTGRKFLDFCEDHHIRPGHGLHAVLSSLWGQGDLAHRPGIRFPEDEGLC
jgi:hypothetical protein